MGVAESRDDHFHRRAAALAGQKFDTVGVLGRSSRYNSVVPEVAESVGVVVDVAVAAS